jgi:hypothetical protein
LGVSRKILLVQNIELMFIWAGTIRIVVGDKCRVQGAPLVWRVEDLIDPDVISLHAGSGLMASWD